MNWPTIIVGAMVAAAFIAIVLSSYRNRKKGKSACSCGSCSSCANCPHSLETCGEKRL